MELKKVLATRVNNIAAKVSHDNLFLFSSSISYYSALALAPFMLIILWIASLIGQNVQQQIIDYAHESFSYAAAEMIEMVFRNINQGVNIGSISGLIGLFILLWTCSLVFIQFRHAFDVIYGHHVPHHEKSGKEVVLERLYAMFIVLAAALLLIVSFMVTGFFEFYVRSGEGQAGFFLYRVLVFMVNFFIYLALFTLIHYLTPSQRPRKRNAVKISALSSVFFVIGNVLLAYYLKRFTASSVYGATGTLLVFLVWAYYSTFTILLSVELFQYLKKSGKISG